MEKLLNVYCSGVIDKSQGGNLIKGCHVWVNLAHLNKCNVLIGGDYYSAFGRESGSVYPASVNEYLTVDSEAWNDISLLCPEMPLPKSQTDHVSLITPTDAAWTNHATAFLHAGRAERISPLHFDWDHTWVAHACLTGRKRFFLFPPQAGWLLNPVINTSALNIPRFSEPDRRELLERLGGQEIVLEAGQGILFPSLFWHGVLYEEPSLAVSVRFEAQPGGRPFAVLPRSWLLQRLVWLFFQQGYGNDADSFLQDYLEIFFREGLDWPSRYREAHALCSEALLQRGEQQGAAMWVGENFSSELALASEELQLYYDTDTAQSAEEGDAKTRAVVDYIFEGVTPPRDTFQACLAAHALNVRQGLPPMRGLVKIQTDTTHEHN